MKFLSLLTASLVSVFLITSCSKDSEVTHTPSPGIEGVWKGKFGIGNEEPWGYYSFRIKSGGVIEELDKSGNAMGTGTWKLEGTTFTAHYAMHPPLENVYSVLATYDANAHKLSGTWGYDESVVDGGFFEQKKQ